jgi:hypothetical protein
VKNSNNTTDTTVTTGDIASNNNTAKDGAMVFGADGFASVGNDNNGNNRNNSGFGNATFGAGAVVATSDLSSSVSHMGVTYGKEADSQQNDGELRMGSSFASVNGITNGNWNTGVGGSQNAAVTISVGSVTLTR